MYSFRRSRRGTKPLWRNGISNLISQQHTHIQESDKVQVMITAACRIQRENIWRRQLLLWKNGIDALAFSSGMAAITLMMELFKPGDHLIVDADLYGGSIRLFNHVSEKNGIEFSSVDCHKENVAAYIRETQKQFISRHQPTQ